VPAEVPRAAKPMTNAVSKLPNLVIAPLVTAAKLATQPCSRTRDEAASIR
jgi:hypothetical protein